MRLLIVEDEVSIAEVVIAYAKREGFDTVYASDGIEALEIFKEGDIDLVVLDLMLPKLNGEEVCRRIRENSSVPVIMLTAKSSEKTMRELADRVPSAVLDARYDFTAGSGFSSPSSSESHCESTSAESTPKRPFDDTTSNVLDRTAPAPTRPKNTDDGTARTDCTAVPWRRSSSVGRAGSLQVTVMLLSW